MVVALRPTAKEVAPTFASLGRLSNQLDPFFVGLKTAIQRAPSGFSALRKILGDGLPPILNRLDPYLATLNGLLKGVRLYKHEITAFLGNATAATQGFLEIDAETNLPVHYLRTMAPLTPEVLSSYPKRLSIQRTNPYFKPEGYADVGQSGVVRDAPVQLGDDGDPARQGVHGQRPRFQRPHRRRSRGRGRLLRPDQALRLQRPALDRDDRPGALQRAAPVPVDRLTLGDDSVPAYVPAALSAENCNFRGRLGFELTGAGGPEAAGTTYRHTIKPPPARPRVRAFPSGGYVIRRSRFVVAIALVLALGVASFAFADGATDNEVTVLGKASPTKLDKKKWKPITLYSGVTTSTTHAVPGQENAEQVTVEYPKNVKFDLDAADTCSASLLGTTTDQAKAACPADSNIGSGVAHANLGHGPDELSDVAVTVFNGPARTTSGCTPTRRPSVPS